MADPTGEGNTVTNATTTASTVGQSTVDGNSWMEQTQYIARAIYEDPTIGPTPLDLHSACAIGYYEFVQDAINKNEELSNHNKGGWTPLMYAASVGHDTLVNLLLEAHVDPNKCSLNGLTPLMVASGCGNESICYFLLQNKADINQVDSQGRTALYFATRQGHHLTVQLLLKEGADMEIGDYENGYTPIMIAAMQGDQIVLDILIACHADINTKANDGYTARSLALKHNQIKIVSFLDEVQMMWFPRSNSTTSTESGNDYDDIHSGPEEVNEMTRKKILKHLGSRSRPRLSLPSDHRPSIVTRRLRFRPTISLPESDIPQSFDEDDDDYGDSFGDIAHAESMEKLAEFLQHVGLEKYYEVFETNEIDFHALLQLSGDDMKKLIDKLGPRRKLEMAVKQMKEQIELVESSGETRLHDDVTPTPYETNEKDLKRQIVHLQSAVNQVTQNLESCEGRLTKEYELRKMAERYCQELQQCRAQAMGASKTLKDTIAIIVRHCHSLKLSQTKLMKQMKDFSKEPKNNSLYNDIASAVTHIGGEIEAVSRSVLQANRECKAVNYQLSSFSN